MTIGNRFARRYGSLAESSPLLLAIFEFEPARLRRFVYEIDRSLLEDIERIDAALTEYAQAVLDGRAPKIAQGSNVSYIGKAKRRTA